MIMSGRFHTFLGGLVVRWRGVILGGVRLVVGGGGCGEVFLIRGVEVGGQLLHIALMSDLKREDFFVLSPKSQK